MSAEEQNILRSFVEGLAVSVIRNPSRRDQQKACGPSDLANTCDVCVAKKIASSFGMGGQVSEDFSLKAWLGTAVHEKLERELPRIYPHAEVEITVRIGDIPGLGVVEGHTDVFLPRKRTVVDWKGLALDTKLPTPTGWTTMGEIQVGDELFDSQGRPCKVLGKSEVHHRTCYRITFEDGKQAVADDEHLWAVTSGEGSRATERVLSTEEIRRTLKLGNGQSRHRVMNAGALELPDADLPIDPYVLGCWLGDGDASEARICKPDEGLFELIRGRGFQIGKPQGSGNQTSRARTIHGLRGLLADCDLLHNKHIPPRYFRGSIQQRLDLLRGLMDTDGTWNKGRRKAVFESVDKRMSLGVYELAISLGQRPVVNEVRRTGFGKEVTAYMVSFTPVHGLNPFLSPVKADLVDVRFEVRARQRVIKSVEPTLTVPTQCIKVDSPDSTYLCTEGMIPTHNTSDKAKIEKYKKQAGPNAYTLGLTAQERTELDDLKIRDRAGLLKPGDVDLARLTSLLSRSEANSGGVPPEYMGQTMLYLYGLRKMGRQADYAVLVFIPRDSNYITDLWVASCPYRPDVAEAVIRRASHLAEVVRSGRATELSPDPECWVCVKRPKFGRRTA
jgi:hypothetical protein